MCSTGNNRRRNAQDATPGTEWNGARSGDLHPVTRPDPDLSTGEHPFQRQADRLARLRHRPQQCHIEAPLRRILDPPALDPAAEIQGPRDVAKEMHPPLADLDQYQLEIRTDDRQRNPRESRPTPEIHDPGAAIQGSRRRERIVDVPLDIPGRGRPDEVRPLPPKPELLGEAPELLLLIRAPSPPWSAHDARIKPGEPSRACSHLLPRSPTSHPARPSTRCG